ncbi:hypothetical protein ADN00_14210 [Ornatilinea apprima]|uniref:Uncharacterized protein n=1 Tax=Ornatilinea apprima TaxID=1134406 RepID=A0A0P6X400_9CHLR|nr:hypothetical protein [Ornatilinea apprima]KPL74147.1 hypothetical protein ADN00_14210 [Ornatilinea apprima]
MTINSKKAWGFLIFFIVLSISVFLIQAISNDLSNVLLVFFEFLKFVFAICIGLFIELLLSEESYQQEIQRVVVSAYRRISDIGKSISSMQEDIDQLIHRYPTNKLHEIETIKVRADEIANNVASSEDDWIDFLKKDIKALEEIEKRKKQIQKISNYSHKYTIQTSPIRQLEEFPEISNNVIDEKMIKSSEQRIEELRSEINALIESLPVAVRTLIDEEPLPRGGKKSEFVYQYLFHYAKENGFIRIPINVGSDINNRKIEITAMKPYRFLLQTACGTEIMTIAGNNHDAIGVVENPFPNIYYKDYFFTLIDFLKLSTVEEYMPVIPNSELDDTLAGTGIVFIKVKIQVEQSIS